MNSILMQFLLLFANFVDNYGVLNEFCMEFASNFKWRISIVERCSNKMIRRIRPKNSIFGGKI